jgi:hypothetical protein
MKIRHLGLLSLVVAACSGEPPADKPADKPAEKPAVEAPPADVDKTFDPATLQAAAEQVALVPSPAEMQRSLDKASVNKALATMVKDRDIQMGVENKDQIAVRCGVVLADLVLTVKDSPKETVVARLDRLAEGLNKLGAGADVQATIADMKTRVLNDAVARDELLKEMDELSGVMVPELEYEAGDWVVPLIQAGSWLEGAHLVSGALKEVGRTDAADNLLKQPAVVDYFIKYVEREGSSKAPDEVVARLKETLSTLKVVVAKPTLAAEDVDTIHSATGAVLTLL